MKGRYIVYFKISFTYSITRCGTKRTMVVMVSTSIMSVVLENRVCFRPPSFLPNVPFPSSFISFSVTLKVVVFSEVSSSLGWGMVIFFGINFEFFDSCSSTVVFIAGEETCNITGISRDRGSFKTVLRLSCVVCPVASTEDVSGLEMTLKWSFFASELELVFWEFYSCWGLLQSEENFDCCPWSSLFGWFIPLLCLFILKCRTLQTMWM